MNRTLVERTTAVTGSLDDGSIVEIVIWELPEPLPPCTHRYRYRLYFGSTGDERVRYDNERGKGDHLHRSGIGQVYAFSSLDQLLDDFERDMQDWSPS